MKPTTLLVENTYCQHRGRQLMVSQSDMDPINRPSLFPMHSTSYLTPYPMDKSRFQRTVVTTLFNPRSGIRVEPFRPGFKWFRDNVTPEESRIWKYWEPLRRRRNVYPPTDWQLLYLDERLGGKFALECLTEFGFHEVVMMPVHDRHPMLTGMLWRYLPLLYPESVPGYEIICTGVDAYEDSMHQLLVEDPIKGCRAVIVPGRTIMPFGGPIRMTKAYANRIVGLNGILPMQGFVRMFDRFPEPMEWPETTRKLLHYMRGQNHLRLKICDAGFLTMLLWNKNFLLDSDTELICDGKRGKECYVYQDIKLV